MTTKEFQEWRQMAQELQARADVCRKRIVERARKTALAAGLDPKICFLHAHNALVSREYGKPWPEVDYSLARKVKWLEKRSWEPGRIVDRITSRAWNKIQGKGNSNV